MSLGKKNKGAALDELLHDRGEQPILVVQMGLNENVAHIEDAQGGPHQHEVVDDVADNDAQDTAGAGSPRNEGADAKVQTPGSCGGVADGSALSIHDDAKGLKV